jgi:chromosome segregation ATPase
MNRLKVSEDERGKARARLSTFREKIANLETHIVQIQEEKDQLKKLVESTELLRVDLSRKDAVIKSQREALQKSKESLSYTQESSAGKTNELEKQIR